MLPAPIACPDAATDAYPLLSNRLAGLRERCIGLADSMERSAEGLEATGVPPAEALLHDLSQFRRQVAELLSLIPSGDFQPTTFGEIAELLHDGELADRCMVSLDRFLRLRGEGPAAAELAVEQEQALELRAKILSGSVSKTLMQELAESRHPWCELVSLVTEFDRLDDERWNELSTSVMRQLGPSIATAAARGRVTLVPANESAPEAAGSLDVTIAEFAPVEEAERGDETDGKARAAVSSSMRGSVSDEARKDEPAVDEPVSTLCPEVARTESAQGAGMTFVASQSASADAGCIGLTSSSVDLERDASCESGRVAELAKIALGASDPARCAWVSELIVELVAAGRSGLAYHLARCLEDRRNRACVAIPSSLIRVWAIGQGVLFPRGELAALLHGDLDAIPTRNQATSDKDWNATLSLLTRAALLRPAIVAPATRAASWLRSLPWEETTANTIGIWGNQLYNYCTCVSLDSEKLGGFRKGLARRGAEAASTGRLRQELAADIRRWLAQAPPPPLRYEAATPLFLKAHWTLRAPSPSSERLRWAEWQRAGRTIDAIMTDILADRRQDAPRVRAEMDRIARDLLPSLQPGRSSPGQGPLQDDQMELRDRLLQTLSFAQRWLAIVAMPTGEASGFLPQAAEDLLREIRGRHAAVLEELRALRNRATSRPVQAAFAILAMAVENVRQLVESESTGEVTEPDPRHLLHAELLKIPTIRLDAAWEPELDRRRLEEEILRSLTSPEADWPTAFETRMTIDDRDSAGRILSLPHWTVEERAGLQKRLDEALTLHSDKPDRSRTVNKRLIETAETLPSAGTWEHADLLARLERLRTMLQSDLETNALLPLRPDASAQDPLTAPAPPRSAAEEHDSTSVFV